MVRTGRYAPNRPDTGSTTARSVDEIALIRDTINHYGPVFIAPLSIQICRAGVQKKFGGLLELAPLALMPSAGLHSKKSNWQTVLGLPRSPHSNISRKGTQ